MTNTSFPPVADSLRAKTLPGFTLNDIREPGHGSRTGLRLAQCEWQVWSLSRRDVLRKQVSDRYVNGEKLEESALNRVAAVVRAYDPCLSCSTHAMRQPAIRIRLVDSAGRGLDEIAN